MKRAILLAALLINVDLAAAYDEPYVMGTGRLLPQGEAKVVLSQLQSNESKDVLEAYQTIFAEYSAGLDKRYRGNRPGITVYAFTSVTDIARSMAKDRSPESIIYLICFDCHGGFPSRAVENLSNKIQGQREIWVLSGRWISIDMPKDKRKWRVLHFGAAE